ncbi:hypothetical protein Hanom_Chr12g01139991 [Helianthus anomalus]
MVTGTDPIANQLTNRLEQCTKRNIVRNTYCWLYPFTTVMYFNLHISEYGPG